LRVAASAGALPNALAGRGTFPYRARAFAIASSIAGLRPIHLARTMPAGSTTTMVGKPLTP
jgi:hypothetical protein